MSKTGSAAKVKLNSFDDLFGSSEMQTTGSEQIINAPLAELHDFKNHPFRVVDDEKMEETTESIRQYGVLVPGIARPRTDGGYELIAGHRRKHGSQRAGKSEMPVIVRNYSDDEATIIMVDSNIQREDILPSEKAKAYKMKYEAMKHQGKKSGKQYICDKLDISIDMCETLLDDGKINLFLDGVNEIPSDTGGILKTVRMREIKQLIKDYPKTFMIITNRPQDTRDFNNVPIFNLMKLSRDEMEEFIKKNVDEEDVKSMMFNSIRGNERFVQIINTPLILSRLIEIVRYKKEIPHSEGEIIAEFLNCLLLREKEEKQDARLDIKRLTYLLRMIAFESLENKEANSGMTESEIIKYCVKAMDTYKFEYDTLYALDIMLQLGILEKRENMYVFSHQAYQDHYYAMEELAVIQS